MSRTLAVGLVLFGGMGAVCGQPPNARIGEAVPREAQARQQEVEKRRAELDEVMRQRQLLQMAEQRALAARGAMVRPLWIDEQLERWVFEQYGDASGGRQVLNSLMATEIVNIDRACKLTQVQKQKLRLAGLGDIKRFFDRYEEVKRKTQTIEHAEQKLQEIWQDISPLQMSLQAGLFHEDSLLVKSLRNTLTGEQFARYDAMARKHRATRHRENVLNAVAMLKGGFERSVAALERDIVLREEQRQELITLMTHETKPSRRPSPYDSQVLLLQLGRLPEEKLKRLFDRDQWEIMNRQLAGFQRLEPMLKQAGLMPAEDDEASTTENGPATLTR